MRLIAYNGQMRYKSDPITFSYRYYEDDSYGTVFGGYNFYNTTNRREEIKYGLCGYIRDITLYPA